MEIAGYIAAILIGISLGLIGGGGSILTVPVLVYIMHVNPVLATTYSLFVVGSCSLVGGARAMAKGRIDIPAVLNFGLASIASVYIVRKFLLPAIPEVLFHIGSLQIDKGIFFMILFALLMLLAAFSMIRSRNREVEEEIKKPARPHVLVFQGMIVGAITGLLGAGGGFLIIPALVLVNRLPMKTAVGSSLAIIAISCLFGFFTSLSQYSINWLQLILFTAIAVAGIFVGVLLSDRIPGAALRKGFGWFVLAMAVLILARELFFA